MSYAIEKVINEIKSRCGSKFDVDGIQGMIEGMKHPMPPMPDGIAVVEIEAEPIEEDKKGEAEEPQLPGGEDNCPKCGKSPCECETEEKPEEAEEEEKSDEASAEGMEAITDTKESMDEVTPAEQDKMDEILKAIKTFFPDENTEDVLVRIVSKLIDR